MSIVRRPAATESDQALAALDQAEQLLRDETRHSTNILRAPAATLERAGRLDEALVAMRKLPICCSAEDLSRCRPAGWRSGRGKNEPTALEHARTFLSVGLSPPRAGPARILVSLTRMANGLVEPEIGLFRSLWRASWTIQAGVMDDSRARPAWGGAPRRRSQRTAPAPGRRTAHSRTSADGPAQSPIPRLGDSRAMLAGSAPGQPVREACLSRGGIAGSRERARYRRRP